MELSAKDLRIGNLVIINNPKHHPKLYGVPLEVTGIKETIDFNGETTYSVSLKHTKQEKNTYYETYNQFIKFIEPILVTVDWLRLGGFVKNSNEYQGLICIEYDEGEVYFTGGEGVSFSRPIKYLHNLQNLTYELTGEELTFNL